MFEKIKASDLSSREDIGYVMIRDDHGHDWFRYVGTESFTLQTTLLGLTYSGTLVSYLSPKGHTMVQQFADNEYVTVLVRG